jgi:hypothetical protein
LLKSLAWALERFTDGAPVDKSWKAFERRIAKLFGCKRRGADFRGENGGKDDLTHSLYAVECKLLSKPTYGAMLEACRQAEGAAMVTRTTAVNYEAKEITLNREIERHPIAIVKRKGDRDEDALVIQRLSTFREWHL